MFSDLTIAERSNTLQQYNDELFNKQAEAHTDDYMLVHYELIKLAQKCESYTELGVNQGTTLASVMMFGNVKTINAYDIDLSSYNPAAHLFEQHAAENNINYHIHEASTLDITLDETDLLYIDTVHNCDHLMKEINLHVNKAKKYVVFHDTTISQGIIPLGKCIKQFVEQNDQWELLTECTKSVGFISIKRTGE